MIEFLQDTVLGNVFVRHEQVAGTQHRQQSGFGQVQDMLVSQGRAR